MLATAAPRARVSVDRTAPFLWYTLCVRASAQKWVCERAKELEIETYVPMKREPPAPSVVRKSRTTEPVERPLMPGYVFVSLATAKPRFDLFVADWSQQAVEPIWGCHGFLSSHDGPMAVSEAVVADMRLRERNGEFDLTARTDSGRGFVARWVRVGSWVELVDGPFRLYRGIIEEVSSATLVKVGMHIFGSVTPITVPLDWVRLARTEDHGILISKKNKAMRRTSVPRNGTAV